MSSTAHGFRGRAPVVVSVATLACAVLMAGAPAHAAPPVNDTAARATTIASIPADLEADTREATADAVQRSCVHGRSVWYRYVPATSGRLRVTTIGSSYDTVLAVFSGARSPRTRIACNDDAAGLQSAVRPQLVAGRQYWIAVSSCCGSPRARGGDLELRLSQGPATPSVEVSNLEATAGAVSGRLRLYGDTTCATPSVVEIYVTASQRLGTNVARGYGYRFLSFCSTDPVSWVLRVDSETGWAFQAGTAALDVTAYGYDGFSRSRMLLEDNVTVVDDPVGRTTVSAAPRGSGSRR